MNKKVLVATLAATMLTGAAFAAAVPVTDINEGDSKIGVEYSFSQSVTGESGHADGFGVNLQTGLTDKWALQYSYNKVNLDQSSDVKDHQLNAVYEFHPNFNGYVGGTYIKAGGDHETGLQVGVIGHMPLADRLQGFAKVGFGNDIKNTYQVGATYALNNEFDLSLYYQYDKYSVDNGDGSVKGFHAGIGYNF
ncbi:MAG: porin family protein [Veillonella sp.]|uniref:outer membrane beta-barrel protein n=1 Tax=Veillonella sp. TaxID=1926307 RepID=UPI0025CC1C8F|nr:outer membrane beta-barrel protein [Veillonella sp.]MBE6079996.1 porin family protein [Veillonella sp.]